MRVYVLKHKRVEEAALLIRPHLSDSASITLTQRLNAMTVTDRPEKLDQVGKVLAAFDTPPRGFTFAVKLVRARADVPEGSIAREIGGLGAKLKSMFQFNDYALIDSVVLRAVGRRAASTRSSARSTRSPSPSATPGAGNELLLSPFSLSKIYKSGERSAAFLRPLYRSSMPVTLSQTLVVGASKEEKSKSALILILHAQELPRGDAETGPTGRRRPRRPTARSPRSPTCREAEAGDEAVSEFRVKAGWPDGSVAEQSVMAADIGDGAPRGRAPRRPRLRDQAPRLLARRRTTKRRRGRVKMAEFLIFNQELIALLKAGLPVVRSLRDPARAPEEPGPAPGAHGRARARQLGLLDLRGVRRGGRPLPAPLLDVAEGGREVGRDRGRPAPLPQVPEDGHRADPQGRVDARLSGHPDRALGRPDHDPDDLRHPALHRVLRRLRRGAAAADGRRPRHRHLPARTTSSSSPAPSASRASCCTGGSRRRRDACGSTPSC